MASNDVYIVSACRTGIGALNGQYSKIPAATLGSIVIKQCLERAGISGDDVSQIIMGQVLTAGQGQNPARIASTLAGIPLHVPAYTINMLCGSSVKTVSLGYQAIRNGDSDIVVCGGQENMTMAHHSVYLRKGIRFGHMDLNDTLLVDGLLDATERVHMGVTAEFVAVKYNVSREEQDKIALESQRRATNAVREGHFVKEIVPVKEATTLVPIINDEHIKPDTTLDKLSKLNTAFIKDPSKKPTVTVGNASGINDGAAAVIICSESQMKLKKLKPLAKIVAFAESGLHYMEMGLGPIKAIDEVLKKAKWSKDDVDLYEINEAYAAHSIVIMEQLGLDSKKVNVNGGAIALGHPLAASGARVLVTLLYSLERLQLKKGVAALCIGGGMGIAIAIERS